MHNMLNLPHGPHIKDPTSTRFHSLGAREGGFGFGISFIFYEICQPNKRISDKSEPPHAYSRNAYKKNKLFFLLVDKS